MDHMPDFEADIGVGRCVYWDINFAHWMTEHLCEWFWLDPAHVTKLLRAEWL